MSSLTVKSYLAKIVYENSEIHLCNSVDSSSLRDVKVPLKPKGGFFSPYHTGSGI